jgi:hypothetical protein
MRRLGASLLLALAACGGGGETVAVQVSMGLDESTCLTTDPSRVRFACDTSVGVWVREVDSDGFSGTIIQQACVDLPGDAPTLADLPPVLQEIDLDGLSDRAVILELAVNSPGIAAEGCPTLDDFVLETLVYGETSPIVLSAAGGALDLELFCEIYDDPAVFCQEDCEADYDLCVSEPVGPCDTAYDECVALCRDGDGDCQAVCDAEYKNCLNGEVDGEGEVSCEGADTECYATCDAEGGAEDCYLLCDTQYAECVEARCSGERTTCIEACGAEGGEACISVEP